MFHLPRAGTAALECDAADLLLLLDGIDLGPAQRRPRFTRRLDPAVGAQGGYR